MNKQHFRPIPGYPGYAAGTHGEIYSLLSGTTMKPRLNRRGYLQVNLSRGSRKSRRTRYVHSVVAEAHIGPRPEHMVIDHIDDDKLNNSADNLQYMTLMDNSVKTAYQK